LSFGAHGESRNSFKRLITLYLSRFREVTKK
jgi:hypothetical protein